MIRAYLCTLALSIGGYELGAYSPDYPSYVIWGAFAVLGLLLTQWSFRRAIERARNETARAILDDAQQHYGE